MKKKKSQLPKGKVKPESASPAPSESRRTFVNRLWKALGVLAAVEFSGVVGAFLFSGKRNRKAPVPQRLVEAGPVDSFQPDSVTVFRGGRFYLVRLKDGGFLALSLRCTHLGCSVQWEAEKNRFVCPCHSSVFALSGEVKSPPAPRALDYYPVHIENGMVKVDVGRRMQRQKFSKKQVVYA